MADIGTLWVQAEVQGQMEVQVQWHMQGLVKVCTRYLNNNSGPGWRLQGQEVGAGTAAGKPGLAGLVILYLV